MKRKIMKALSLVMAVIMCMGTFAVAFAADEIPEGYTAVYTAEDLYNIRNDLAGKYILMNDIDLSAYENWVPIGTYKEPFTGEFNGDNKAINNLKIKIDSEEKVAYAALFGTVTDSRISNIAVRECSIDVNAKSDNIWGVCASGLVALGNRDSIIENCIVSGVISVETDKKICAGGIAASFSGTIRNCVNLASVYAYVPSEYDCDYIYTGGIAGEFSGSLERSSNHGNVKAEYNYPEEFRGFVDIGGIAGNSMSGGSINDCYNVGTVTENTNQTLNLGGISGYSATVTNSHNYGSLNFSDDEYYAGGITGITEFWFEDVWEGTNEKIKYAELKNCFYPDYVIKSTGYIDEEYITNVSALSKEEFKNKENFIGFDFDNIWTMNEEEGYPVLKNQPEISENIPETPTTEPTTEPSTEPTTNPTTTEPEKDDCFLSELWIARTLKQMIDYVVNIIEDICNIFLTLI